MNRKILFVSLNVLALLITGCASTKQEEKLSPLELMKQNRVDEARSQFLLSVDINELDEDGNSVLHLAAKRNDADLCTFFMIKGADPALKNNEGDTPLLIAVKKNAVDAAKAITSMDANTLFDRDSEDKTALDIALASSDIYYDLFITTKAGEIRDVDGQTIVHYFVRTQNLKGVESCINKGIPINVKENDKKTPLDVAFENLIDENSVEIAAALIIGGAEEVETEFSYFQDAIQARNESLRFDDGQSPLHFAAIYGHEAIAEYLLKHKADASAQDSSGATPLHEAVRYGNLSIAELLLKNGANVNAKDNLGKTPIMLIVPKERLVPTYDLLISHKADINQKDMFGDTLIHNATMMNVDSSILAKLIENGADVNVRNKEGVTPLEIAVQKQDVKTVKLLTANGADIHTKDTNGNSPLSLSMNASTEMFEAVINESNATTQDSEGNTPLHTALLVDAPFSKISYIISLTSDINIRNRDGNSALYIAAQKNLQKVGEMLLSKDADIFSTNTNNSSPLRLALKNGGAVQDWLITSKTIKETDGSGNTALHYAAEWQYAEAIKSLLTKGADIKVRNANGETPLFNAAKSNNPQIIQQLVDGGADIQSRDNLGNSAIQIAVRWDAPESVKKLVELGININSQNSSGKSALNEAVVSGKYEMCQLLLSMGANPNSCDTDGVSILMDGIRICNKDIVKLLLSYGANPNIQDINGKNAYHEAAYVGEKSIIALIRNAGGNPLSRDKSGVTPFAMVLGKDITVIREVLGNSSNITDSDGNSPVHIVVKSNASDELLKTLIAEGYPVDTRNADGYTALNYAIEANDIETAKILLKNGANPFQMIDKKGRNGVTIALEKNNPKMLNNIVKYASGLSDVQGNTILHYAAKTSSEKTVKQLLGYGLDKNVKNVSGETPYTIAERWKRPEIADLLK